MIGQTLHNQFRIDAFIAAGGMGAVYRVLDLKRSVSLAMKVLHADLQEDPAILKRFQREARALQQLAHPNIVPFYGLYQTEDFAFLLERFIDGPTLKALLRRQQGQPLPMGDALAILKALCAALGYAHAHEVVHCDVKPGNVMVDQGGNVYLTDFGIARHAESTTTTLGQAGSPAYMTPEQIRGDPVTSATDVYALGVLLFEMLTGQRPFSGEEDDSESGGTTRAERIRYAHLKLSPPDPASLNASLSTELAAVLLKALAKNPHDRYQNTQALYKATSNAVGVSPKNVAYKINLLQPNVQTIPADLRFSPGQTTGGEAVLPTTKQRRPNGWLVALLGSLALVAILSALGAMFFLPGLGNSATPVSPGDNRLGAISDGPAATVMPPAQDIQTMTDPESTTRSEEELQVSPQDELSPQERVVLAINGLKSYRFEGTDISGDNSGTVAGEYDANQGTTYWNFQYPDSAQASIASREKLCYQNDLGPWNCMESTAADELMYESYGMSREMLLRIVLGKPGSMEGWNVAVSNHYYRKDRISGDECHLFYVEEQHTITGTNRESIREFVLCFDIVTYEPLRLKSKIWAVDNGNRTLTGERNVQFLDINEPVEIVFPDS